MTLDELIELLTEIRDDLDAGDWDVKGAFQPSYPLMGEMDEVAYSEKQEQVYLALGSGTEYGKRAMWSGGNIDLEEDEED